MKVFVLSNVTLEPLKAELPRWQLQFGPFDAISQSLLDPTSPAHAHGLDAVLCHVDGDVLLGDARYGLDAPHAGDDVLEALASFCNVHPDRLVLANTVCLAPWRLATWADAQLTDSVGALAADFNRRLRELADSCRNLVLFDIERLYLRHGFEALVNNNFWYFGRIRYTPRMFRLLAAELEGVLGAWRGEGAKVLVLDLDNTLWGGVLGEEGPGGIKLSEDGAGKCYRDVQRVVLGLKRMGVLLAINSKNNAAEVEEVFASHPMMLLSLDDFAATRINWRDKATNLRELAEELGLGPDSMVFIDDMPAERSLVSELVPEVAVPAFPSRCEDLPAWLREEVVYRHFPRYRVTDADRSRPAQYRARKRRAEAGRGVSLESFLAGLEIEIAVHVDDEWLVDRAAQMTQRTNQFNVTTRRYTSADMARFVSEPRYRVLAADYRDRFGAEGVVGLAIVDLDQARLDSFLMSCRVIGRGVEAQLMRHVEMQCREAGLASLRAEFLPTARNEPARSLFDEQGFERTRTGECGAMSYVKRLS